MNSEEVSGDHANVATGLFTTLAVNRTHTVKNTTGDIKNITGNGSFAN